MGSRIVDSEGKFCKCALHRVSPSVLTPKRLIYIEYAELQVIGVDFVGFFGDSEGSPAHLGSGIVDSEGKFCKCALHRVRPSMLTPKRLSYIEYDGLQVIGVDFLGFFGNLRGLQLTWDA